VAESGPVADQQVSDERSQKAAAPDPTTCRRSEVASASATTSASHGQLRAVQALIGHLAATIPDAVRA